MILLLPAFLRYIETSDPDQTHSPQTGCLFLIFGPIRLYGLYLWRYLLQPGIYVFLISIGGIIFLIMRFGIVVRILEILADNWERISERLWQDNLNAEELFRSASRRNTQRTLSILEQFLIRFATVRMLNRLLDSGPFDFLGLNSAVPTVLAAIAQDEARPLAERLNAVNALSQHGYRRQLLEIARDLRRAGQVVCQAAEALELRLDWHASEQAWSYLLDHEDPMVRLRAANHLKFIPQYQGAADACLRTMFTDERIPIKTRLEAAAALGRMERLLDHEYNTLLEWMNHAPDAEARLHAAYTLACLRHLPAALEKLRRYSIEYQLEDHLRPIAIEYLGRLDQVNDLSPLGRIDWLDSVIRLRVGRILLENGHPLEAIRGWLALSQDTRVPLKHRLEALQYARQVYREQRSAHLPVDMLLNALENLCSDGEPAPEMRLEAARVLIQFGENDRARQILLTLSRAKTFELSIRRQASRELSRLATMTIP